MKKFLVALVLGAIGLPSVSASAPAAPSNSNPDEIIAVRSEMEELKRMESQIRDRMQALEERLNRTAGQQSPPEAAPSSSSQAQPAPPNERTVPAAAVIPGQPMQGTLTASDLEPLPIGGGMTTPGRRGLFSVPMGSGAQLRLMDLALFFTGAGGWSTQHGEALKQLEGGHHDPNVRGFTLQGLELYMGGAVDPYIDFQTTLNFSVNSEGESHFEVEEGFATTQQLPFGVEEYGLQIQAGWFFAHFGRWNQQHVHDWYWIDQPIVTSRFFGPDNLRQAGVNLSWLVPLVPWYSNFDFAIQNAVGETMYSFGANGDIGAVPEGEHEGGGHGGEHGGHGHADMGLPGGRPFVSNEVRSLADMAYELRWANAFDITDSWSTEFGASAALGPNPTGKDSRTWLAGVDFVAKWRPLPSDRGWPYLIVQAEAMWRNYEAAAYDCAEGGYVCDEGGLTGFLPKQTLKDFGMYAQVLWGFQRGWSAGLRGGYSKGRGGASFVLHEEGGNDVLEPISIADDPFRSERWRLSPVLIYQPTHFSKIALQYNYDRTTFLEENNNHTVWLQLQVMLGSDPAHRY